MENALSQPDQLDPTRGDDDLAAILYTSGTTGRSKARCLVIKICSQMLKYWSIAGLSLIAIHCFMRCLSTIPGLFVAGNIMTRVGGAMIYLPKFDAETMIRMMPQATSMMGVPPSIRVCLLTAA